MCAEELKDVVRDENVNAEGRYAPRNFQVGMPPRHFRVTRQPPLAMLATGQCCKCLVSLCLHPVLPRVPRYLPLHYMERAKLHAYSQPASSRQSLGPGWSGRQHLTHQSPVYNTTWGQLLLEVSYCLRPWLGPVPLAHWPVGCRQIENLERQSSMESSQTSGKAHGGDSIICMYSVTVLLVASDALIHVVPCIP